MEEHSCNLWFQYYLPEKQEHLVKQMAIQYKAESALSMPCYLQDLTSGDKVH